MGPGVPGQDGSMMERLDPFAGSPSKHESWAAWATLSAEHVDPEPVAHPEDEKFDEDDELPVAR